MSTRKARRRWSGFLLGLAAVASLYGWGAEPGYGDPGVAASDPAFPPAALISGPDIAWERETLTFGPAIAGEILPFEFRFFNPGRQPLEILSVKPSCGCTTSGAYDKRVLPGSSGRLPLKLDTQGMRGPIRRSIRVRTNAPGREETVLWLEGRVEVAFELEPPQVIFGLVDPLGQEPQRKVNIKRSLTEPIALTGIESGSPAFQPVLRTVAPGETYEITVGITPGLAPGAYVSQIKLLTASSRLPVISIPVSAFLPPAVDIRPQALFLPAGPLPVSAIKTVSLRFWRTSTGQVLEAVCRPAGPTPRIKTLEEGRAYQIEVVFPAGFQLPSPEGAKLVIKTNQAGAGELVVPVAAETRNRPGVR